MSPRLERRPPFHEFVRLLSSLFLLNWILGGTTNEIKVDDGRLYGYFTFGNLIRRRPGIIRLGVIRLGRSEAEGIFGSRETILKSVVQIGEGV